MKGIVIDYLHCVLLGVTKMLVKFWFDAKHRDTHFYIGDKVQCMCSEHHGIKKYYVRIHCFVHVLKLHVPANEEYLCS